MNGELRISFEPDNEAAKQFVTNGVDNHNIATTGHGAYYPVAYFLRAADGEVLGGLLGMVWGKWLHIKFVWVAEPARKHGEARRLVETAEAYARKRGCIGSHLETFSFQARPLYESLGYRVIGEIGDYPPGHTFFFLSKRLEPLEQSR
jgi:GNAT superfamily N-acetyltransferase